MEYLRSIFTRVYDFLLAFSELWWNLFMIAFMLMLIFSPRVRHSSRELVRTMGRVIRREEDDAV